MSQRIFYFKIYLVSLPSDPLDKGCWIELNSAIPAEFSSAAYSVQSAHLLHFPVTVSSLKSFTARVQHFRLSQREGANVWWAWLLVLTYAHFNTQGPVVQRPINPNPGLTLSSGFFIPLFKGLSLLFITHPVIKLLAKRILLNFLLKLSDLKSDFTLTLGYLNPSLNLPRFITQKRV